MQKFTQEVTFSRVFMPNLKFQNILLGIVLMIFLASAVSALSVSNNGGTFTSNNSVGSYAWTNASNAKISDNLYAVSTITDHNNPTNYLKITNFNFSIPLGATINGIVATVEKHQNCTSGSCTSSVSDYVVKLVKDGVIIGTNKANSSIWSTSDLKTSYGNQTYLWGSSWNVSDINNVNTGIVISGQRTLGGDRTLFIDYVNLTVYYTPDGISPVLTVPSNITTEATSSAGASVNFNVSATDNMDGSIPVVCNAVSGATFALGTNVITCHVTDSSNNSVSKSFSVTVQDTTAPELTVPSNITTEATSSAGAAVAFSFNASDYYLVSNVCDHNSGDIFPLGTTNVNCNALDSSNNSVSKSFSVTVQDTAAPTLILSSDIVLESNILNGAVVSFSNSANDLVDGALTVLCDHNSGDIFPLGNTLVACNATDNSGNSGVGIFNVNVTDTTAPSITISGNNPETVEVGTSYSDAGATANDIFDGSLTVSATSNVNSAMVGVYYVNYTVTDSNGNTADDVRIVNVIDTTAPIISLPSSQTLEATSSAGANFDFVVNATDNSGNSTDVFCDYASGNFPIAVTIVTCNSTDSSNNTQIQSFSVTVQDTTAPSINVPSDITVEATSADGASVSFVVSSNDMVDGALTVLCDHNSGDIFPLGTTNVNCNVSDSSNNTNYSSFNILIQDTTAPSITISGNNPETVEVGTSYSDAGATANDIVNGSLEVSSSNNININLLGTYYVNYTAVDSAGNVATASREVRVVDTTKPIFGSVSDITVEATSSAGANVNYLIPTATDNYDESPSVSCSNNINIESVGALFPIGNRTVTCTATDSSGNKASVSFVVSVVDTTAPSIELNGANETSITQGDVYTELGANASDIVDGDLTANISVTGTLDTNTVGTYVLTYSVKDSHGNTNSTNRMVVVNARPSSGGGGGSNSHLILNNTNATLISTTNSTGSTNLIGSNDNSGNTSVGNNSSPNISPGITGAVIGGLGTGSWTVIGLVVLALAGGYWFLVSRRRK